MATTITAKDVMTLRKRTGLGMMECKSALTETEGDFDKAVEHLRAKLKGKMDERTDREASEGVIAIESSGTSVAMIQLQSETDFVARNDGFVNAANQIVKLILEGPDGPTEGSDAITKIVDDLRISTGENCSFKSGVKLTGPVVGSYLHHNKQLGAVIACEGDFCDELLTGLCQHITAAAPPMMPQPIGIDADALPADQVESQKAVFIQQAEASGKPREIAEKMVVGKLKKWVDENTLLGQTYIRELDAKKPIRDYLPADSKVINFARFQLG